MFKPTHKKKSNINIIPMIDVIFFLLVFFMLFTSFRSNPAGIEMQLPKAVTVTEQKDQQMIIDVSEEGQFFIDGEQLPLSKIRELAGEKSKNDSSMVVVINADKETRYKFVVDLMDGLRKEGIYNLALAAEPEQKNES